jgi:hypothetical protein
MAREQRAEPRAHRHDEDPRSGLVSRGECP